MRLRSAQICLTVVCMIFGVLLMVQFRTQGKIAKTVQAESSADQAQIVSNLYDANVTLRKEVTLLERQLIESRQQTGAARESELRADLQKLRIINGSAPAAGPGVEMTIAADVRPEDIQDLINEFRNAGTEALAINGRRVTLRTAVRSDRGAILLGGERLAQPYVFAAVGASDTLERALTRKGGLVSYLQNTYPEGQIRVQKSANVLLPASREADAFAIAQPERKG